VASIPRLALAVLLLCPLACQKESAGPAIEKTKEEVPKKKDPEPTPKVKVSEPTRHRAVTEPCARETKRTTFAPRVITPIPDGAPCKANADCKDQKNGRCSGNGTCTYDACYVDADCRVDGKGGVCLCNEEGLQGYSCAGGNCSVDADCGKNYCSPSFGMQCGKGLAGYYCHTAKDECGNDEDCTNDSGRGYCAYNKAVGYWACGYGVCLG
jgi:hypothetical protein